MKPVGALSLVVSVLMTQACNPKPVSRGPVSQLSEAPVAYVGHGAMFDRNGNELQVTDEFLERSQTFYRDELLDRSTSDQRRRFDALRKQLEGGAELDATSRLTIGAAMLNWLIRATQPEDSAQLLGINHHMRRALRAHNVPEVIRRRIADAGMATASVSQPLTSSTRGQAYRSLCAQNGVPIPPDWGTPQWIRRGPLDNEFISGELEAEVFTFQSRSPEGVCIALPRFNGNTIELLGVICLGKASGKACFWDNQTGISASPQFFPVRGEVVPFDRFGGGTDLIASVGGVCTGCHAGENPFVIHPKTPLGSPILDGLPLLADRWYEPIVQPGWPENPGPNQTPLSVAGKCDECHAARSPGGRFPELSTVIAGYCDQVLKLAMERTMPPDVEGEPRISGTFFNDPHAIALRNQCAAEPPPRSDKARFVRQTPAPVTLAPNSQFAASVTFSNAGTTRWTGSHSIAVAPPDVGGNPVWSSAPVALGTQGQPVMPADQQTGTFSLRAPTQSATYALSFVLRDPVGRVLASSPRAHVVVAAPNEPFDNATLTIVNAPTTLLNGMNAMVLVAATNTGTRRWTAPGYGLRLTRRAPVSLPSFSVGMPSGGVNAGASVSFPVVITCTGTGLGSFSARLIGPAGPFGQEVGRTMACQPR